MNAEKLRLQIRIEQLRYLYDDQLIHSDLKLHFSNKHIPPEYIFNKQYRRVAGRPHAQDYLYCKPFYVIKNRHRVYSHHKNGTFIREPIKCLPETELMLLELAKMVCSKSKYDKRYAKDSFNDVYCALLLRFREVDTNRPASQVFNYVLSAGINTLKNVNRRQRRWEEHTHQLYDIIL